MLPYNFICKLWCIILICSDCVADQMSFYSSIQFFILLCCMYDFDLFSEKHLYGYCGLGVIRQAEEPFPSSFAVPPLPAANVPCVHVEGTSWAAQSNQSGHWYSRRRGWRRKAREVAWLPGGCLWTAGWQRLVGREACRLLLVISYRGRIWKLRCLPWTSRIRGRMRIKLIKTTYVSLHDTFSPAPRLTFNYMTSFCEVVLLVVSLFWSCTCCYKEKLDQRMSWDLVKK